MQVFEGSHAGGQFESRIERQFDLLFAEEVAGEACGFLEVFLCGCR